MDHSYNNPFSFLSSSLQVASWDPGGRTMGAENLAEFIMSFPGLNILKCTMEEFPEIFQWWQYKIKQGLQSLPGNVKPT